MAAGIQPINVICNIRQIIPVSNFPLSMNDKNGKKIAIRVMGKDYLFIIILLIYIILIQYASIFYEIYRNFRILIIMPKCNPSW